MIDFNILHKYSDNIVISNNLACVLQQIDLLFDTDIDDVLGDSDFGTNYDRYLYTLDISNASLEATIIEDLHKINLCGFTPSVTVKIVEGTQRDIAIIDITLTGDYEEYNKTYIIK